MSDYSEKLAINGGKPVRDAGLPSSYPGASLYGEEELKAVSEVIRRKSPFRYYGFDLAEKTKEFENCFSSKMGSRHALAVTSGTASLIVALKALGIGPGDKVIVPANTFEATPGSVIIAGAVPVFADVDESMNIGPHEIEKLADKYTKAVIPVHILGNPCEMDKIMNIAKKHNLAVIEDNAQSCGLKFKGKYCGSFGDAGAFSMQINKIITTGDGGVMTTDDEKVYERAVRYHDQGMYREKEGFLSMNEEDDIFVGQNYRMSEITAAIALEQLKKLDYITGTMRKIKYMVKNSIKDIDGIKFRRINDEEGDVGSTLLMMLPDKELAKRFIEALNAENVSCGSLYGGRPVYMMPQILKQKTVDKNGYPFNQLEEKVSYDVGMCPNVEKELPKNVCIFFNPLLTEKDAEDIARGIRKVAKHLL
jgi:Predicted pyridoxal phosphate-dependent enzyme apparently involved in regulation of cell wall biogenesis